MYSFSQEGNDVSPSCGYHPVRVLVGEHASAWSIGHGMLRLSETFIWWIGLCVAWGLLSQVFINIPMMRWVAKTLYHGEIAAWRRQIKGIIYAHGRGIVLLKGDTSTLRWKSCSLTLFYGAWTVFINLFMVLVVIIPIAQWLAEVF
jgi:hypothetical protein